MVLHTTLLQLSALKGCEDGLGEWIAARCGQYVPLGDDFIGGMFLFFAHRICSLAGAVKVCPQCDEEILTHMAHQLQSSTAESAADRVSRYTRQPELVVRINKDAFKSLLPLPQSESINLIFKRLWLESTKLFPEVDYIYYGDKFGAFVGYERLPPKFVEEFDFSKSTGVFGAEFRAPDGAGAVQLCEMCPPAFAARPGAKTYYFVNDEGVYLQSYKEHAYDPRERPWYKAAAGKGELVWLEIYNHSSGHTLGMTAAMAIMAGSEVAAVVAADFTVSYFSDFLQYVTDVIAHEAGFIVNWETGLMVASSLGISHVAKTIDSDDSTAQVRYHWTQVSDTMVQSSIRAWDLIYPRGGDREGEIC